MLCTLVFAHKFNLYPFFGINFKMVIWSNKNLNSTYLNLILFIFCQAGVTESGLSCKGAATTEAFYFFIYSFIYWLTEIS